MGSFCLNRQQRVAPQANGWECIPKLRCCPNLRNLIFTCAYVLSFCLTNSPPYLSPMDSPTAAPTEEALTLAARGLHEQCIGALEEQLHARGMSHRALAESIGTSPSYVSQLFRGQRLVNMLLLARVEEALGLRFRITLEEQGPFPRSQPAQMQYLSADKAPKHSKKQKKKKKKDGPSKKKKKG